MADKVQGSVGVIGELDRHEGEEAREDGG